MNRVMRRPLHTLWFPEVVVCRNDGNETEMSVQSDAIYETQLTLNQEFISSCYLRISVTGNSAGFSVGTIMAGFQYYQSLTLSHIKKQEMSVPIDTQENANVVPQICDKHIHIDTKPYMVRQL